jgi:cytochrome c553
MSPAPKRIHAPKVMVETACIPHRPVRARTWQGSPAVGIALYTCAIACRRAARLVLSNPELTTPMMRPLPIASLALVLLASAVAAQDATAPATDTAVAAPVATTTAAPAVAPGDATRGKGLAYTCRGCHGVTGYQNAYPTYRVPKLGGQSQTYLNAALLEYRKGSRKHPTMQAQAESFSEQDIADIAAYLASIK